MNIWSLLGMSVTLVAIFCIIMMEVFQDKSYYETYKWYFCGFLIASGILLWFLGRHLHARSKKKPPEVENSSSSAATSPEDGENSENQEEGGEEEAGPFFLFSPLYWGPILVTFGIIVIFIVPMSSANKVKARGSINSVQRTNLFAPVTPTNAEPNLVLIKPAKFPEFKVQGLIYRVGNPSVVINGKAFFVGDYLEEAEIVAIERQSMTLEIRGQRKVYVLEK